MTSEVWPLEALLPSVAGWGLPGARGVWPVEPLDGPAWAWLLDAVVEARLTGLLASAVDAGRLRTTEEQAAQARAAHVHALCAAVVLETALVELVDALAAQGTDVRVLKGSAVAHLDYPDASLRLFADVDLLVRGEDIDAAATLLQGAGYRRRSVQARRGFDRRFGKGATFTSADGIEVDLHRIFVLGPLGLRTRPEDLWERTETFDLAGRSVGALDADLRFLHACFHAALGSVVPGLVAQRDLAQLLLSGRLDLARVERLVRAWRAEAVVARAVRGTWETLRLDDITALSSWAARYRPDRAAERELAVYVDPERNSYAAKTRASFAALPRLRDKAAFALAMSLPTRGFRPERAG